MSDGIRGIEAAWFQAGKPLVLCEVKVLTLPVRWSRSVAKATTIRTTRIF